MSSNALQEGEGVVDPFAANLLDEQMNLDLVLKTQWLGIGAFDPDAWHPVIPLAVSGSEAETNRSVERLLGRFHEVEIIGKMHDARGIGLVEFDPTDRLELVWHRQSFVAECYGIGTSAARARALSVTQECTQASSKRIDGNTVAR